jgi:tetratricopeptide (TPR) repeat protein
MFDSINKTPVLLAMYERYLDDRDAGKFAIAASQRYTTPTLERLAEAGDRYRRRAAVLALGLLADYESNNVVGCALVDSDRGVRMLAENSIRLLWTRAGNRHQRKQLAVIIRLNESGDYEKAVQSATELLEQAPWFAEIWNQRAVANFNLKHYTDSIRDCRQTLEINPYHFDAAAGMGRCYLKLDDRISTLECFRRALRLNPNLEQIRAQVVYLQKSLKDK